MSSGNSPGWAASGTNAAVSAEARGSDLAKEQQQRRGAGEELGGSLGPAARDEHKHSIEGAKIPSSGVASSTGAASDLPGLSQEQVQSPSQGPNTGRVGALSSLEQPGSTTHSAAVMAPPSLVSPTLVASPSPLRPPPFPLPSLLLGPASLAEASSSLSPARLRPGERPALRKTLLTLPSYPPVSPLTKQGNAPLGRPLPEPASPQPLLSLGPDTARGVQQAVQQAAEGTRKAGSSTGLLLRPQTSGDGSFKASPSPAISVPPSPVPLPLDQGRLSLPVRPQPIRPGSVKVMGSQSGGHASSTLLHSTSPDPAPVARPPLPAPAMPSSPALHRTALGAPSLTSQPVARTPRPSQSSPALLQTTAPLLSLPALGAVPGGARSGAALLHSVSGPLRPAPGMRPSSEPQAGTAPPSSVAPSAVPASTSPLALSTTPKADLSSHKAVDRTQDALAPRPASSGAHEASGAGRAGGNGGSGAAERGDTAADEERGEPEGVEPRAQGSLDGGGGPGVEGRSGAEGKDAPSSAGGSVGGVPPPMEDQGRAQSEVSAEGPRRAEAQDQTRATSAALDSSAAAPPPPTLGVTPLAVGPTLAPSPSPRMGVAPGDSLSTPTLVLPPFFTGLPYHRPGTPLAKHQRRFLELQRRLQSTEESDYQELRAALKAMKTADRSRRAAGAEKRSLDMLLQEGREMQRTQRIGILAKRRKTLQPPSRAIHLSSWERVSSSYNASAPAASQPRPFDTSGALSSSGAPRAEMKPALGLALRPVRQGNTAAASDQATGSAAPLWGPGGVGAPSVQGPRGEASDMGQWLSLGSTATPGTGAGGPGVKAAGTPSGGAGTPRGVSNGGSKPAAYQTSGGANPGAYQAPPLPATPAPHTPSPLTPLGPPGAARGLLSGGPLPRLSPLGPTPAAVPGLVAGTSQPRLLVLPGSSAQKTPRQGPRLPVAGPGAATSGTMSPIGPLRLSPHADIRLLPHLTSPAGATASSGAGSGAPTLPAAAPAMGRPMPAPAAPGGPMQKLGPVLTGATSASAKAVSGPASPLELGPPARDSSAQGPVPVELLGSEASPVQAPLARPGPPVSPGLLQLGQPAVDLGGGEDALSLPGPAVGLKAVAQRGVQPMKMPLAAPGGAFLSLGLSVAEPDAPRESPLLLGTPAKARPEE